MYSIFDGAIMAYNQPFFMHSDGQAVRAFQDNINDEKSTMSHHPEHFTLFRIGEYDDKNGVVEQESPLSLGNGVTFKEYPKVEQDMQILTELLETTIQKLETM